MDKVLRFLGAAFFAAALICFGIAIRTAALGGEDEIVYINGLRGEYTLWISCGWGIVSVGGAICTLRRGSRGRAAMIFRAMLVTLFITGGVLLVLGTAVNKHRYYMYNNMYNYGSHRIVVHRVGEEYVCFQQSGRYTYKAFYRSDKPVTSLDIMWDKEGLYIASGEHEGRDGGEIVREFEFFPYSEHNR